MSNLKYAGIEMLKNFTKNCANKSAKPEREKIRAFHIKLLW
jgi:hypothetical protein